MCPQNFQIRGRIATLVALPTGGAQNAGEPKANEGGQSGVQGGEAPMAMSPQTKERESLPTGGTQTAGEP